MAYEYVKKTYGVQPEVGMRVTFTEEGTIANGKRGVIVAKRCYDHYVHVRFDGTNYATPCHPLGLEYRAPEATHES